MNLKNKVCQIMLVFLALLFSTVVVVNAADYPKRAINLYIPFEVGQSADISARGIAAQMEKFFKKPVVCINKTGAGGSICFDFVRNVKPDGYHIGWMTGSALTHTNTRRLPYHFKEGWDLISRINIMATTITVRADAPWKGLRDFVEDAKKNPGKFKIGHGGTGSFTHLIAAAFEEEAGIDVIQVPIGKRRRPGLLGGEVHAISVHPPEIVGMVRGGEMRVLGIVFPRRMKEFPEAPTMQELGYNITLLQFLGIFAPKGVPQKFRMRLAEAIKKATEQKKYQSLASKKALGIAYLGPNEFVKFAEEQDSVVNGLVEKFGLKKK